MALKWPSKDPDEVLDYTIDWSRYLGSNSISSVSWYFYDADGVKTLVADGETVNGLTSGSQTTSGQLTTIVLLNGTDNAEYKVTCAIGFGSGLIAERTVYIKIREN